jgi:ABC-type multidrug transport system fused ATPase/permease subunit
MTKNVAKVDILIDEAVFEAAPTVLRIIFTTIGIGIFIGWQYGLLGTVTSLILTVTATYSNRQLSIFRRKARHDERFLERFGTEMTSNWRTLKYFGMEQRRCQENQLLLDRHYIKEAKRFRYFVNSLCTQEVIVNLSRACLWALIIINLKPNVTTIGGSVLALSWMERIYSNFYRISSFQRRLNESWESLKELVGLMTNVPEVRQPDYPQWPELEGRVEFNDVTFSYSGTDVPAIRDFNLVVEPNQTIAIVGASGSGKSTLVELLMRSYDPCEGAVIVDGIELSQYDYDRYRAEAVSIVSQDVQLFDMNVRENIRFGRPDAADDEVIAAAHQAYADNFIVNFPQGYDTLVGEDGILLSGGQKQRLAIARALLRQPRVLVLDEATSSVDSLTEARLQRALAILLKGRTSFVVAHRLSTIRNADLVLVLDHVRLRTLRRSIAARGQVLEAPAR